MSLALSVLSFVAGVQLSVAASVVVGVAAAGVLALRRPTMVFALLVLVGALRGGQVAQAWHAVRQLDGQATKLAATVREVEERATRSSVALDVHGIGRHAVGVGGVTLWLFVRESVQRGQRLTVSCPWTVRERPSVLVPSAPSLTCDNPIIDAREPAHPVVALLDRGRQRFVRAVQTALPEPAASLAIGLTLGETRTFDAQIVEDFRVSGTSHVLALSGYNVSVLVAVLVATVPALVGRRPAFALILVALAAFLILTGVPPSLLRASVMGALLIVARWIGRRATAARLLGLSVIGLVAVEPGLMADLGFLLSVVATLGLILAADRLAPPKRLPGFIRNIVGSSTAAFVFTLPILVPLFHRLSPVAPLANLLVLPLVPVLFFGSAGVGVLALVAPNLAAVVGTPVVWLSNAFLGLIAWIARLPFASLTLDLPNPLPWIFPAAVLIAALVWRERPCAICTCPVRPAPWQP
ncbi:MAG: ComEC/Rec2 family competence protein [Candidatus Kerfeldbacteria bacterium]|nr:ComEC/Rec2 family competence protein [Candidatus Kerfeldbacteria bacterium]